MALVAAIFLVYRPCWYGGFFFDDDVHLVNNPVLKPGGLAKIWVPGGYINYWPVTFTAYWLQYQFWGLQPLGYHLVNLTLHALSALLVWRVLVRLQIPGAFFAASIFALLPVNVESVAWVSQLKGILSLVLALISVLFYLSNEERASRWRYALAITAFLLSALAKGTAITLPAVLLACAWWQRGRITRRDLLRVVPYILIGVLMAGVEVWAQHNVAEGDVVRTDGFFSRAAIAGCAVWFYLGKLILPVGLSPIYPRWTIDGRGVVTYLPGVMGVILLAWAWGRRGTWGRPVVMLIVCYVALLFPVLGFVNIYFMRYSLVSDHWQYIATIVPCAAFAGIATTLARRYLRQTAAVSAAAALLIVLGILSWRQSRVFVNAETFFETVIDRNPDCWLAHYDLAVAEAHGGKNDLAIVHYRRALEIRPDYVEAQVNLGNVLLGRGELDSAINLFQKALEIKPDFADARTDLGNAFFARGQIDAAIDQYRRALALKPNYVEARGNLGNALLRRGDAGSAIEQYLLALGINPDDAEIHYNLAVALAGRGRIESAISEYQKALEFKPDYAEAHNNLAAILFSSGQLDSAILHFQKALEEIKPENASVHNNLALVLAANGRIDDAIAHYQRALEIDPNYVDARANLAAAISRRGKGGSANAADPKARQVASDDAEAHCISATALARNGQAAAAIAEYQKALEIKPGYALAHNNLGVVLVSSGKIDSGIAHFRSAIEIQPDYAEAHFNLANALASRGEFDAAIAEYEKALAIKPDYAAAQKNLAAVRSAREKVLKTKPVQLGSP